MFGGSGGRVRVGVVIAILFRRPTFSEEFVLFVDYLCVGLVVNRGILTH